MGVVVARSGRFRLGRRGGEPQPVMLLLITKKEEGEGGK